MVIIMVIIFIPRFISRYSSMPEANASLNIEWLKKKLFERAHL